VTPRWPRTRLTIERLDYRGQVLSTRQVWGEVRTAERDVDLADTGQRDFIARGLVQARAETRGDSARDGEHVIDPQGRRWTVVGVVDYESPWASGQTLLLEADVAGGH